MTPPVRLFLYGALRSDGPEHASFFRGRALAIRRARMAGRLVALPCGTIVAVDGDGLVRGELVESHDVSILEDLNRYEGSGADAAALYAPAWREAILPDGARVTALAWFAADPAASLAAGVPLPDGDAPAEVAPLG